ncbi:uncharacterized protein LOC123665862 [Melitaea cinxia]|uniref:uncharacterized protein LOC123665862 n=1 Tax=Melitaea cinxia TaxID=113334 RepID=UPI001E271572|nr:uncharacterized protein LOC123665862 [Melitaea cinxia]
MTAELVKDATYKLRHAEKIKDMHSHSITYELGTIAAGIQERFQRMLKLYKKYANLKDFEKATYTVPEIMNAYHLMQGDYNEIRLEKSLFHDIVKKHESTHTPKKRLPTNQMKKQTTPTGPKQPSGGRKQMKWSVNRDMY